MYQELYKTCIHFHKVSQYDSKHLMHWIDFLSPIFLDIGILVFYLILGKVVYQYSCTVLYCILVLLLTQSFLYYSPILYVHYVHTVLYTTPHVDWRKEYLRKGMKLVNTSHCTGWRNEWRKEWIIEYLYTQVPYVM